MKKFFKQLFFVCISMIGLTASAKITASDIFQKGLDCVQKGQYEQAAKYFQRAAEQGDAFAQCNLGSYYESGTGVNVDYEKSIYWYTKAAQQGHADAQMELGICYAKLGDKESAMHWIYKAAEQGNKKAINTLELLNGGN